MFLSRALRQCARRTTISPVACAPSQRAFQLFVLPRSTRCPTQPWTPIVQTQRSASASPARSIYHYPENLNVFNAGPLPVVVSGTVRLICASVLAIGALYVAPSIMLEGSAPWYMPVLVAIGAAVPLLATGIAWGGYVHHVNILLPTAARKSKEDLMRFASSMPPNAIVQIKSMWFRPWPVTKEIFFEDFRRLHKSKVRLSNLESIPQKNRAVADKNPMLNWLATRIMGTYFVNDRPVKDRSRVPGIWRKIWEQIPMAGEASVRQKYENKKPVLPSNRVAPTLRPMQNSLRNKKS